MKAVVIGLGRIGLPLALVAADSGIKVVGVDIKKTLIQMLKEKKEPFYEPMLRELLEKHCQKKFYAKLQEEAVGDIEEADYIIITVGTEFVKYPEKPKIDRIFSIIDNILKIGIRGKTIIIRVTLPIGYTDKIRKKIEKTGLKEGKDFYLAFVPERIMEGKAIEEAWRNTRFAFANELAFLAEKNGIDVIEAIEAANKGYKRNQIPIPGPVSGYCLGKDPYILEGAFEEIIEKRGFNSVWYYGRKANDWLIDKIVEEVDGKKDDFRYSHGIEIARILVNKGYLVSVCDPFIDKNHYTKLPKDLEERVRKFNSLENAIKDIDTIIFTVPHSEYLNLDLKNLVKGRKSPLRIIDLWNIFKNKMKDEAIVYVGLGK